MRLVFSPTYSWLVIAILAVVLLAGIVWSYRARLRTVAPIWAKILFGLRITSWLLLMLAMLRPSLESSEETLNDATLLLLADTSRSMTTRDGPASQSRRDSLLEVMARNSSALKELSETFAVRQYDFSEQLVPVDQFGPEAEGQQTAIGATLEDLLNEIGQERVSGVILLSDGAQRAFSPRNQEPRLLALRYGEQRIPIYPVPFGGTGFSENALDLAIEEMVVDPLAFENTTVPISLRLRAVGAAGKQVRVKLKVENRIGIAPGGTGDLYVPLISGETRPVQELAIDGNNAVVPVELSYVPDSSGEFKIRVEVEPLEGEVKTVNNAKETIITVQQGGIRVAYFHSIPPEPKFIKAVGRTEQIQIDSQLLFLGALKNKTRIPDTWFEEGKYDAYLMGDVPAEAFTDEQLEELSKRILEDGAGLIMLGGIRSFGPGGYAGTPLDDLLPVAMRRSEIQTGNVVSKDLHLTRDLRIEPTSQGARHYLMRLDNAADPTVKWEQLPPLQGANKLAPKNQLVQILAESKRGDPLLFSHEVGRARVLSFAGDSTWRWVLEGYSQEHLRFWQQVVLWLARKELDRDQQVWVRVDSRNFGQGQRVPITFGARDEKGEPLGDAAFEIEVIGPEETKFQPAIQGTGGERAAEFSETRKPGDYWAKVTATLGGAPIGQPAWTRFLVDAGDLELDNPAADYAQLQEIAKLSGGQMIPPEKLGDYLQSLLDDDLPRFELSQIRRTSLWDNWYFLLLLVGLLALEWYFRKKKGLV